MLYQLEKRLINFNPEINLTPVYGTSYLPVIIDQPSDEQASDEQRITSLCDLVTFVIHGKMLIQNLWIISAEAYQGRE